MASSESTQPADGREGRPLGAAANALRNTWKAMNEWGDEFERKHFDGDLVGALAAAPRMVGEATKNTIESVKEWKDELEREIEREIQTQIEEDEIVVVARWRYSPADGWPIDIRAVPDINGARTINQLQAGELVDISEERAGADGVVYVRLSDGRGWLFDQKPGVGVLCVREEVVERPPPERRGSDPTPSVSDAEEEESRRPPPALWQEVQRLQQGLHEERERRRGRAAALRVLDEAVRPLRAELAQEPVLQSAAESERSVSEHRLHAVERAFEELQERHHQLLSRRASQEAETQWHNLEAKRADSAARLRAGGQVRIWARDGPEMEALKLAKMELAELLSRVDEDRLQKRRELRDLMAQVESVERERDQLRRKDVYVAPKGSFMTSMRRLWTVANGRDDPYHNLESEVT